ncbi:MAG: Crp/Fnr family transcriptional regulator [Campylobacterales bacterium]|nr:Crp/Fnr family transcriptional regulator [Campylobacterales bacterium]
MNSTTLVEQPTNQQLILSEIQKSPLVSQHSKKLFLKKGDDPLNTLDTRNNFYFVMNGKIKIYQIELNSAKEQTLYLLGRSDMFDVLSLLDGSENEYISEVLEDAELIAVPMEDIREMILKDSGFRHYFYAYLAEKLRSMENLALSLSFYDVYQRLLQLFTKFTYIKDNKPVLKTIDNLKHEDLASMIGTVRKVLNRSLQKLKQDGVIELSRKNIRIKNFQKLLDKLNI